MLKKMGFNGLYYAVSISISVRILSQGNGDISNGIKLIWYM